MVASIEAKKNSSNKWEIFVGNGREPTRIDVIEWAQECESLGAGNRFGKIHKIPHIGWRKLIVKERYKKTSILNSYSESQALYFVHSYMCQPRDKNHIIAMTNYNEVHIPTIINSGYLFGCQFHREESGLTGLGILKEYSKL